jgi:hypothetical protein
VLRFSRTTQPYRNHRRRHRTGNPERTSSAGYNTPFGTPSPN